MNNNQVDATGWLAQRAAEARRPRQPRQRVRDHHEPPRIMWWAALVSCAAGLLLAYIGWSSREPG